MIFAQWFPELGLSEGLLQTVKIIAAVGGAVVGWFVCDPLTRLLYRLSFRAPTPGPVLLLSKGAGAATLALVVYFAIHLGGGGGFGSGPGPGGLPGKGPGKGGDKIIADGSAKDAKIVKDKVDGPKFNGKLETVHIEILGGKRFDDDGKERFYLLERKSPAVNIDDVEEYFKKHEAKIHVVAVLTRDTGIELDLIGSPLDKLRKRAAQYKIKVLTLNED